MSNPRFPNICPLGKLSTTAGTPLLLSTNCGALGGQVGGTFQSPPTQGTALRQVLLTAPAANTLLVYILPRGYTASANPGLIIAVINPGQTIALPPSGSQFGMLPENFVADSDTSGNILYGCGFFF